MPREVKALKWLVVDLLAAHVDELIEVAGEALRALPPDARHALLAVARRKGCLDDAALDALVDETATALDVSGCGDAVTDTGVRALAARGALRSVVAADITSCRGITADGIRELVSGAPNLEVLRCGGDPACDAACRDAIAPARPGGANGAIGPTWRSTKWANREWRPMVSMRWHHGAEPAATSCDAPSLFATGSAPAASLAGHANAPADLHAAVMHELTTLLAGRVPRLNESLSGVTVHIERPMQPSGPNVWVLFPTYHGEREVFNGFCEDKQCECSGELAESPMPGWMGSGQGPVEFCLSRVWGK